MKKSQCRSTLDHQSQLHANYRGETAPHTHITPLQKKKPTVGKTNTLHKLGV